MKRIIFIIMAMFLAMNVSAQNYRDDGKEYEIYCMVRYSFYGNQLHINIGEKSYNIEGYNKKHPDLAEMLNLLAKRGWTIVCCYGIHHGSVSTQCFTMKKIVKEDKEAEEGLVLIE